jgi:hypothetical protein
MQSIAWFERIIGREGINACLVVKGRFEMVSNKSSSLSDCVIESSRTRMESLVMHATRNGIVEVQQCNYLLEVNGDLVCLLPLACMLVSHL